MQVLNRVRQAWRLAPLAAGQPAPSLSLTAEEGTWIKLKDFQGHLNVVLVFFRSLRDDATDEALRGLDGVAEAAEQLDAILFGVTHHRTDELRDLRARLGLGFHLVYDPMALTARKYGCAGRVRPSVRPGVVVVGKDGRVGASWTTWPPAEELLAVLARLEGRDVPEIQAERGFTGVRDPGAPADKARVISADEARALLAVDDSAFILLDVRTEAEHEAFHPQGARNIPLDELPHRYQDLHQNTDIICISQTGGQSMTAAEFLTSVGMSDVYTVSDGMASWPGSPA
ncbi:MAG: rhodanese-like domain-containing protein [Pseudomonadota bacterium]